MPSPQIFEFQGHFENIELFNGSFDEASLQMMFDGFFLQGKRIKKPFTVIERRRESTETQLVTVCQSQEVILFDTPPRYVLHKQK